MRTKCVQTRGGFALIELVVVIGILSLMFGLTAFGFARLQDTFAISSADAAITESGGTAARRARSGHQQSAWGVYFPYDEGTRRMEHIIIFAGDDFDTRDQSMDKRFPFPSSAKLTDVSLGGDQVSDGNDHEVVFEPLSGNTDQYGTITIEVFGEEREVEVSPEGVMTREH